MADGGEDSAKEILAEVVNAFQQGLGKELVAVVLFGSRAREEATETSDWDLLLIAHHLPQKHFQRHLKLKKMLPASWRGQVAIVARTPEEFESHLPALFLDIALDGIILYDTDEYMAERLARLRSMIEAQRLQRERIQDGFAWRWRDFPGFNWKLEWETTA